MGAKNAGVLWQQSTIKLILTNPLYTGNMVQNRTETISLRTNQRKEIPAEQQTVVPNTHPSLISMEEFHEAQMKLKLKGERRSNGQESLLHTSPYVPIAEWECILKRTGADIRAGNTENMERSTVALTM